MEAEISSICNSEVKKLKTDGIPGALEENKKTDWSGQYKIKFLFEM